MDKYISIKVVLDNILDHPMLRDVSFERAVNHTINFMRILGCPRMFEEKASLVNISNWRGALPCDFNDIIQIRTHSSCDRKNYGVFRHKIGRAHV